MSDGVSKITFEQSAQERSARFESGPNKVGDNFDKLSETVEESDEDILKSAKNNQISGSTYWKWRCPECGKQTSNRSNLIRHRQSMHFGEIKFFCDQCEFKTKSNSHLKEHMQRMHTKGSKYQINQMGHFSCNQCGKSFSQMKGITIHQRVHSTSLKLPAGQSL